MKKTTKTVDRISYHYDRKDIVKALASLRTEDNELGPIPDMIPANFQELPEVLTLTYEFESSRGDE